MRFRKLPYGIQIYLWLPPLTPGRLTPVLKYMSVIHDWLNSFFLHHAEETNQTWSKDDEDTCIQYNFMLSSLSFICVKSAFFCRNTSVSFTRVCYWFESWSVGFFFGRARFPSNQLLLIWVMVGGFSFRKTSVSFTIVCYLLESCSVGFVSILRFFHTILSFIFLQSWVCCWKGVDVHPWITDMDDHIIRRKVVLICI